VQHSYTPPTGALQEVERPLPPGWHLTGPMGVTRAGDTPAGAAATAAAPRVEDPAILEFLEEAQGEGGCGYCRGQGGCAAAPCLTAPIMSCCRVTAPHGNVHITQAVLDGCRLQHYLAVALSFTLFPSHQHQLPGHP
jgi:hypothetical protein